MRSQQSLLNIGKQISNEGLEQMLTELESMTEEETQRRLAEASELGRSGGRHD